MENDDIFLKFLIEERKNNIKSTKLYEEIRNEKNDAERKLLMLIEYGNMNIISKIKRDIIISIQKNNPNNYNQHWLKYHFNNVSEHTVKYYLDMKKVKFDFDKILENNNINKEDIIEISFYENENEMSYLCNINYINKLLNKLGLSEIHKYDNTIMKHYNDNYIDSLKYNAIIDLPESIKVLKKS